MQEKVVLIMNCGHHLDWLILNVYLARKSPTLGERENQLAIIQMKWKELLLFNHVLVLKKTMNVMWAISSKINNVFHRLALLTLNHQQNVMHITLSPVDIGKLQEIFVKEELNISL